MRTLTTTLLTLSALTLSACDLDIFNIFNTPEIEHELVEGGWIFEVDQIEYSGDCEDFDDGMERIHMLGHIEYVGDQQLELVLEGMLLTGEQFGNSLFVEATELYDDPVADLPVCEEDKDTEAGEARCSIAVDPLPSGLYITLDGVIDGPGVFRGALVVESSELDRSCLVETRYRARYDREVSGYSSGGMGAPPIEGEDASTSPE